ncbi:Uncharacterised protein [Vibrio cholerae]|nr:Uncharacterised protein [Vibrio cholerae]
MKSANGPSLTRTTSPASNMVLGRGASLAFSRRFRIASASLSVIGAGRSDVPPMNPITRGTLRTKCQDSSFMIICTST